MVASGMGSDWDVVIIGAGAAGIAAARRLSGSGLSTLMLEAAQGIGGRACTVAVAGMALDLGCGWLHSANRNPWVALAEAGAFTLDRREPAWGEQFRDLGFSAAEQEAADEALAAWRRRLQAKPPPSDRAADALEPDGAWNAYLEALSGYISGAALENVSVQDYLAYDQASTGQDWRVREGYGTLVCSSLPPATALRLATPVTAIGLEPSGVSLATRAGTIAARAAIITVPTNTLAEGRIALPPALNPWLDAAGDLPLGQNEKMFLEIVGSSPFEPETHVVGDPKDPGTGTYTIRPFGRPVIEAFFGGAGARVLAETGPAAGSARAIDELAALFGSAIRAKLRPLTASNWSRRTHVGGAYSCARPGCAAARNRLARPFDGRLFFAGEATEPRDFSTAHGAYQTGVRAAEEVIAALAPQAPRRPA
jgi:monoamine oxidase